jgi:hypothetical protein
LARACQLAGGKSLGRTIRVSKATEMLEPAFKPEAESRGHPHVDEL